MGCIGVLTHISVRKHDFFFHLSQGAIPEILGNTKEEFFSVKLEKMRECAEICYEEIMKIPCISCPSKPEGSMFTMVKN